MKSYMAPADVERNWIHINADGLVLGRLAVEIARRLQGKHRPEYTPHIDTGDFIVVTNVDKMVVTGKKLAQRMVQRYSGYPGGLKEEPLGSLMERAPDRVLNLAVRRMLPKTRLGRQMLKKLKAYSGNDHPHTAQVPTTIQLEHAKRG
jgi:large subunit ribosomal protein L13